MAKHAHMKHCDGSCCTEDLHFLPMKMKHCTCRFFNLDL